MDKNYILGPNKGNFSCELGQIMTRYDFLWAIDMTDSEQCLN